MTTHEVNKRCRQFVAAHSDRGTYELALYIRHETNIYSQTVHVNVIASAIESYRREVSQRVRDAAVRW